MFNIMLNKIELSIILFAIGFCGWAVIEFIVWLLSFVSVTIN